MLSVIKRIPSVCEMRNKADNQGYEELEVSCLKQGSVINGFCPEQRWLHTPTKLRAQHSPFTAFRGDDKDIKRSTVGSIFGFSLSLF